MTQCRINRLDLLILPCLLICVLFSVVDVSGAEAFDIRKVQEAVGGGVGSAGDTIPGSKQIGITGGSTYTGTVVRILGSLSLLILLLFVGIWALKRIYNRGNSRLSGGAMDLLETLPLGQNRSVILVRVLDSVFLLSQTSQSITLLHRFEADKSVELITTAKGGTSIGQFRDMVNSFIGKMKRDGTGMKGQPV